ncbi:acyltransferase [Nocardioides sp.]|uniref:acyltransferase family protein n=1 Tax=Nocardioides sp. TaxID=35761 RepID=UPI00261E3B16|nr:acyltransferase [Nocardioides sp.]
MTSTAARRRYPTLDAVRAAGALMVVLTHVAFNTGQINHGWPGAVLSRLDFGVALFFVVSGFLLSRPWFQARTAGTPDPALGHYLWKRALRILPIYWVVVVVALAADPANRHASLGDWVSNLTLTQLYRPAPLSSSLTQMWSLCTEVAFYLVLPFLLRLLLGRGRFSLRRTLAGFAGLSVLGLAWTAFAQQIAPSDWHVGQWLPAYVLWFSVGVAFAACSVVPSVTARLDDVARDLTGWWILGLALFAIACSDVAGPRLLVPPTSWEAVAKSLLYAASAGCLILPLVFGPEREGRVRQFMTGRVPTWLGEISYGIFCIHMFVLVVGMRVAGIDPFTGRFAEVLAFTLAITLVAAGLSYRFLESPVLRLKNRGPLARRDPAMSATATTADH